MIMRLIALAITAFTFAACGEPEPEYTHEVTTRDGLSVVRYDCGDLEGTALTNALNSSHSYFERKALPAIKAFTAFLEEVQASNRRVSNQELLDELEKFSDAMDDMQAYTNTTGCSFVNRVVN